MDKGDAKTRTTVKIRGREYVMKGSEPEEYIHKVAIYVDRKMEEIEAVNPYLSTTMIAVLTALNIADELLKEREQVDALRKEIERLKDTIKDTAPQLYDINQKYRRMERKDQAPGNERRNA